MKPIGTIVVDRRGDGDRAFIKTANGWEECTAPPRSDGVSDGDSEIWYPESAVREVSA